MMITSGDSPSIVSKASVTVGQSRNASTRNAQPGRLSSTTSATTFERAMSTPVRNCDPTTNTRGNDIGAVVDALETPAGSSTAKSTTSSGASRPARTIEGGESTRIVNVATAAIDTINAEAPTTVRFRMRRVRIGFSTIPYETNPRSTLVTMRTTSRGHPSKPMRSGVMATITGQWTR